MFREYSTLQRASPRNAEAIRDTGERRGGKGRNKKGARKVGSREKTPVYFPEDLYLRVPLYDWRDVKLKKLTIAVRKGPLSVILA